MPPAGTSPVASYRVFKSADVAEARIFHVPSTAPRTVNRPSASGVALSEATSSSEATTRTRVAPAGDADGR